MNNEVVQKVLDDSQRLYALPQTLAEVLRIIRDESSGADDLAKVLIKDPAMTTRILRVVNSPYYGVGREVGSMSQAVVTLGTRQVTALALSTSIYGMTNNWKASFDRMRFWRHSLEVAIAARTIAQKVKYPKLEEIFVAGLLHDIGLVVLENSFPDMFRKIWAEGTKYGSLADLEDTAWKTNHARVGQFLLEQWHLPEMICGAVGLHHNVFTRGTSEEELIPGQIVNLANRLSHFSIAESQLGAVELDLENRDIIRENLGLSVDDLMSIEKHLFSQTVNESKYLEIDIGSSEEVLAEANRLLFEQYAAVEQLFEENKRMQRQMAGDQVKSGFLESFKSTTSRFTHYVDAASGTIKRRAMEVVAAVENGTIVDPSGLVASSAKAIVEDTQAVESVLADMQKLTATESALYYDQDVVSAVDNRIKKELETIAETAKVC